MLKVGLVGCGFMGRMHATVYGALEGVELVAIADRRAEVSDAFAAQWGAKGHPDLASMLQTEAIDYVDICLPTHQHAEASLAAIAAGKHVFCEKPMARSVEEADRMIAAAQAARVRLMIGHCIRFWPEYEIVHRLVAEGTLGALTSINLTRYGAFPSWSSENWLADEALSGGAALDMHIHDTDYALHVLGKPASMTSHGTVDTRGVSQIFTTMSYANVIAHLEGGWNLPASAPFKMAIRAIFERGAAIMDGGPLTIYEDGKDPVEPEVPKMSAAGAGGNLSDLGGYYAELKYFTDCLASGAPMDRCTPESSRQSLAVALEEIEQAKSRVGK